MKIPIFMIFQFFGLIVTWANKALEDGKISAAEGLELVVGLAGLLGVTPEFSVSDYLDAPENLTKEKPALSLDPDQPPGRPGPDASP